jgi:hypothetical protein
MNAEPETKFTVIGPWRMGHGLGLGFVYFPCEGDIREALKMMVS